MCHFESVQLHEGATFIAKIKYLNQTLSDSIYFPREGNSVNSLQTIHFLGTHIGNSRKKKGTGYISLHVSLRDPDSSPKPHIKAHLKRGIMINKLRSV